MHRPRLTRDGRQLDPRERDLSKQKIRTILQERFYPTKTSETLARMTAAEVIIVPGGANFRGGERYTERIRKTAEAIYVALSR